MPYQTLHTLSDNSPKNLDSTQLLTGTAPWNNEHGSWYVPKRPKQVIQSLCQIKSQRLLHAFYLSWILRQHNCRTSTQLPTLLTLAIHRQHYRRVKIFRISMKYSRRRLSVKEILTNKTDMFALNTSPVITVVVWQEILISEYKTFHKGHASGSLTCHKGTYKYPGCSQYIYFM